ncbi:ribonuclease Z [Nanoarchaeota archaeon]
MEITILGTACMQPTKERNHVGILLRYKNENILFDCGENIQRQLRKANIKPAKITKVFISHWHGDHVLGLPGLMNSMGADQSTKILKIYGPKGTKKHIKHMLIAFPSKSTIKHEIIEINPNNKSKIIDFGDFIIESRKLKHGMVCLGYNFMEKDRRRIKPKYIKKIPGIKLGKLQKGKSIQHNNNKITPKEATYLVKGKKITIIMDTRPCSNFVRLAKNSDLLISESTYLDEHKKLAVKYNHMTSKEVSSLAKKSKAKQLILLHFSSRYKNTDKIKKEARKIFKNSICAEDLMKFSV